MELKRRVEEEFEQWGRSLRREPLVLFGARQTGKTHLAKRFAERSSQRFHDVNFWKNESLKEAFTLEGAPLRDPRRIVQRLEVLLGESIDIENDLLLFDEIQDCPVAYESLKFFKEDLPLLDVIASGSYLQLFLEGGAKVEKHPVGSTKEVFLSPLTYGEFLENGSPALFEYFSSFSLSGDQALDPLYERELRKYFLYYLFVGGLPEPVRIFLELREGSLDGATRQVRSKQNDLIRQYKDDLNKYARHSDTPKIRKLFDNIPLQLNQYQEESVGRYRFTEVAGKQGYRVVRGAFDYLFRSGLVIKNQVIGRSSHPLVAASKKEQMNCFKAFFFDIGLLHAVLDVPFEAIQREELGGYKGYIAENFVAQQFYAADLRELYSFKNPLRSQSAEVEFLLSKNGAIVPIEVKSSSRYTRSRSLQYYVQRFQPVEAYKLVPNLVSQGDGYVSLPIYFAERLTGER
jgi:predicted AAA+ superfamily ATPase